MNRDEFNETMLDALSYAIGLRESSRLLFSLKSNIEENIDITFVPDLLPSVFKATIESIIDSLHLEQKSIEILNQFVSPPELSKEETSCRLKLLNNTELQNKNPIQKVETCDIYVCYYDKDQTVLEVKIIMMDKTYELLLLKNDPYKEFINGSIPSNWNLIRERIYKFLEENYSEFFEKNRGE